MPLVPGATAVPLVIPQLNGLAHGLGMALATRSYALLLINIGGLDTLSPAFKCTPSPSVGGAWRHSRARGAAPRVQKAIEARVDLGDSMRMQRP